MVEKVSNSAPRKYSFADLSAAAAKMAGEEMSTMLNRPLNKAEEQKAATLGRMLSKMVLKEMDIA